MGTQRDSINLLFPLVAEPGFNDIFGKHITTEQKPVIGFAPGFGGKCRAAIGGDEAAQFPSL